VFRLGAPEIVLGFALAPLFRFQEQLVTLPLVYLVALCQPY